MPENTTISSSPYPAPSLESKAAELIKKAEAIEQAREQSRAKINLSDSESLELLQKTIEEIETDRAAAGAREFASRLERRLTAEGGLPADFRKKYEEFILRARFVAFSILSEEEQIDLLRSGLLKYIILQIADPVDVREEIRKSMTVHIDPIELLPFQEKLITAMENSEEKLSSLRLISKNTGQAFDPSLKFWITDYKLSQIGGRDAKSGVLERISYISKNLNAAQLSKPDKDLLLSILAIYDKLRFDPLGPEADEGSPEAARALREYARALGLEASSSEAGAAPVVPPVAKILPPPPAPPRPPVSPIVKPAAVVPQGTVVKIQRPAMTSPTPPHEEGSAMRPGEVAAPPVQPAHDRGIPVKSGLSQEDLYRQTLEELNKMREMERPEERKEKSEKRLEKPTAKPQTEEQKIVDEELTSPSLAPSRGGEKGEVAPPHSTFDIQHSNFSINDALARAGLKNEKVEPHVSGSGEVVPGHDDDIDKELADLDQRIKRGDD